MIRSRRTGTPDDGRARLGYLEGILGIGTAARFPGHRSSGQPPEFVPPCGEMSNEDDDATRNGLLSKGHHSVQIFNGLGCPSRRSSALVAAYVAYKGIHDQIKEAHRRKIGEQRNVALRREKQERLIAATLEVFKFLRPLCR